jgi:hypothetical protein
LASTGKVRTVLVLWGLVLSAAGLSAALPASASAGQASQAQATETLQAFRDGRFRATTSTFTDTSGDNGDAPDLLNGVLIWSDNGTVDVGIGMNQYTLYQDDAMAVYYDVDLDTSTGYAGFDYRATIRGSDGHQSLQRFNGYGFEPVASSGMAWASGPRSLSVSVSRNALGISDSGVRVVVESEYATYATRQLDYAPNSGSYLIRPGGSVTPVSGGPDLVRPVFSRLGLSSSRFRAARSGSSVSSSRARVGTRVRYSLSEASRVKFSVERRAAGRKVGRRCVRPRPSNRSRRKCTRWVKLRGTFSVNGKAGRNAFTFRGRLRRRTLRRGTYRLGARATDGAGNRSSLKRKGFRIVR